MDDIAKYSDAGFHALIGLVIIERLEGRLKAEIDIGPQHFNRAEIVHGGVFATLLDAGCSGAGLYCPYPGRVRRAVTLSLTVNFTGMARDGRITVDGLVTRAGRRIYASTGEVRAADGTLLAHGVGTFQFAPGSEAPDGVPAD